MRIKLEHMSEMKPPTKKILHTHAYIYIHMNVNTDATYNFTSMILKRVLDWKSTDLASECNAATALLWNCGPSIHISNPVSLL